MIGRLAVGSQASQDPVGVERRREDDVLKHQRIHMVRTAKRRQNTAGFQQFEGAQVNLLIAAERIRHSGAIARERRRVEDYAVKAWNGFFVRLRGRMSLQPIEHVGSFKRTFFRQTIRRGVTGGGGGGFFTLIQGMNLVGARPRGVQRKPAEETETVEHLPAADRFSDALVVHLLIEIQPGLLPALQVHVEPQTVQADRHDGAAPRQRAGQKTVGFGQTFELPGGNVVAFDDRAWGKDPLQRGDNHRFTPVHAERRCLQHQHFLIFIDHESTEKIALGVHNAKGSRAGQVPAPRGERRTNSVFEKCLVRIHPIRRQDAHVDFGF